MLPLLQPFPQHRGAGNKLSESGDQGQHLAQRRMDKKDRARARGIPLGNFEHNNGLKLCTETSTLQLKVLNGYRLIQTNLLRSMNREIIEG